jgi:chemotaxis protein methyltransferase CheR
MVSMADKDFRRFSEFIHAECGIKLPLGKKTMVEARLQKRLRLLGMATFREYNEFIFSPSGLAEELSHLIDAITTNTTEFFRESKHFEIMVQAVLPHWVAMRGLTHPLRVWSAGCSSGEEPYTLAMVLSEFAEKTPGFRFSITATDISSQVLEKARRAVYPEDRVAGMSFDLKRKYLLRSKDRQKRLVRIAPDLRERVTFSRLNFMEEFSFKDPMDIIFCRNVMIYFDRATQETLLNKFCRQLRKDGHLFIGHSESLTGMDLPLRQVSPTVYRRV